MAAPTDAIDYAAVLKDLEARKAILEATIASVKQMMGLLQSGLAAGTPAAHDETADLRNHPFLGMSIGEAAKKYLLMAKRKQTVKEIAEALERGGLHHTSPNFQATVATMVGRYAKQDADLLSTGKGEWALAAWYGNRRPKAPEPPKRKRAKTKTSKPATGSGSHANAGPTAKELAEDVLRNANEPMHVDAILKAIKERRGIEVRRGSLVTMLSAYVKAGKVFERTGPGTFALVGAA